MALSQLSDSAVRGIRVAGSVLCLALFAYYVAMTAHWPILWDSSVMHYIDFLMKHGMRPYSEITDMNLPGCYITDGWAVALFGRSDFGWRLYEFFLIAVLAISAMIIGGKRRWFAGIYVASFFIVMHGSEGPIFAVERDEVMVVLLMAATASLFVALRRRIPLLMLVFSFLSGLAIFIKPGALLFHIAFSIFVLVVLLRRRESVGRYIAWWAVGNIGAIALAGSFFFKYRAFSGFLFIVRTVLPTYALTDNPGMMTLLRQSIPPELMPLLAIALLVILLKRDYAGWEQWALLLATGAGAVSYFAQGKGAPYHRYMFVIFALMWIGWQLTDALDGAAVRFRWLGVAGVGVLFFLVAPYYISLMVRSAKPGAPDPAALAFALQRDLQQLGGESLQTQVQCMDLVNGCLGALDRMGLIQNTGTTGDLLLFSPTKSLAVDYYRDYFVTHDRAHPADVVVVGNEWYQSPVATFSKVEAWPEYAAYLRTTYVQVIERHFGAEGAPAYRIYLRKGSDVLAGEVVHPLG
jgi:hypothetical protein